MVTASRSPHVNRFRFSDRRASFGELAPLLARAGELKIGVIRVRGEPVAAQLWLGKGEAVLIDCLGCLPSGSKYSGVLLIGPLMSGVVS
jgi:hypothetical protein